MRLSTKKVSRNGHDIAANWLKIKNALSDSVVDAKDIAEAQTLEAQEMAADYVAKKPFKTVAISLAAGFVLGYLMKR